jgi:hypothetical protein
MDDTNGCGGRYYYVVRIVEEIARQENVPRDQYFRQVLAICRKS